MAELSDRTYGAYFLKYDHSASCPNDALVGADSAGEAESLLTEYMRREDLLRHGDRMQLRVFKEYTPKMDFTVGRKGVLYASYPDKHAKRSR